MTVSNVPKFVDSVQARGRLFFTTNEIVQAEGSRAVEAALRRLAAKGAIRRLLPKSPAFVIVPPEYRSMGLPPVEWWLDDLMGYFGQPYYLGLLSAAAAAGSSHFAVMETQVVTTKWMRPIESGRVRLRFFQKTSIDERFVSVGQNLWSQTRTSGPALTALDILTYRAGGAAKACLILADLAPMIAPTDLMDVLNAGIDIPTVQRLGFLLEHVGAQKLAEAVKKWLSSRTTQMVGLEPDGGDGIVNDRWKVRVNSSLEATA